MNADETEIKERLTKVLETGLSDDCMKAVKKNTDAILYDIQGDLEYRLKDELAPMLVSWVAKMAELSVKAMLAGNEDKMRRYLSCEKHGSDGNYICYTGRTDSPYSTRTIEEAHPVIHGKLFETGALELRKQVANANRDLIASERILDLEDQVNSLVGQVNALTRENNKLKQRISDNISF